MAETRKLAAILAADVVGYSRLAAADEERTLARLRALRSDLIDPTIAVHHGRVVKRTGDGILIEFRSVVDAVRCAIEVQNGMAERNSGLPPERRIEFRIGIHLGDVVEESDGDLMGDGVNIAARLEGIAKPGAICLSEDAYRQVKSRLDLAVSDLGPTELKNIAEPVRVYSLEVSPPAQAKPATAAKTSEEAKPPQPKKHSTLAALAGAVVLLAVIATGAWYFFGANRPATVASNAPATRGEAAHLSIVVLPFANLSGDPNQDYFADGITENLTTELSRIRDSLVIARNTAFTYKGKSIDAKEIGRELGVRYVLEGSVQRDQNRVRVNAQLIDANTGTHLWADRFEDTVADLFKLQDQVVARLANALGYVLVKAEAQKGAYSTNPDAIDLAMRARALTFQFLQQPTKDKLIAIRSLYEEALKIDPNCVPALAGNAGTYFFEHTNGWESSETDYDAKVLGQTDRAIALAPDHPLAYVYKSYYLGMSRRFDDAVRAADAGLAIDPNIAVLYAARAGAEISLGRFDQAKSDLQQAVRLSPRDPRMHSWQQELGDVELGAGRTEAAIDEYRKSLDTGDRSYFIYANLAAAYALAGKLDEAKPYLAEARRLNPKLTVKWYREHAEDIPARSEGLRKAGLPEDDAPHLSIVVLPFANLSGDPSQDYFADGITENLTTELSRIRGTFVIARNTAFTFKGKAVDVKEIGKELGVRYVLEGSVQRDQGRVRINAQLIDAQSGAHLWADRFEEDVGSLFNLQDQLVAQIVNALAGSGGAALAKAEAERGARSTIPDVVDLAMRGFATLYTINGLQSPKEKHEANDAARALFQHALQLDSNDERAIVGNAITYLLDYLYGWGNSDTDYDTKVLRAADRAIAIAPDSVRAYFTKSAYLGNTQRFTESIGAADAGLAINPSYAALYAQRAHAETALGRLDQAKSDLQQAMRLSPRDPSMGLWQTEMGDVELAAGHIRLAIDQYERALHGGHRIYWVHANLAACYALEGRMEEAKSALAEARRLNPKLTVKWYKDHTMDIPNRSEGLRKAGLAEE